MIGTVSDEVRRQQKASAYVKGTLKGPTQKPVPVDDPLAKLIDDFSGSIEPISAPEPEPEPEEDKLVSEPGTPEEGDQKA